MGQKRRAGKEGGEYKMAEGIDILLKKLVSEKFGGKEPKKRISEGKIK